MKMLMNIKTFFAIVLSLLIVFLTLPSGKIQSQTNIATEKTLEKAFILNVNTEERIILVDLGDNTISTDDSVSIKINSETVIVSEKNKPIDLNLLRPGVLLEIKAKIIGAEISAKKVTVKTNLEDWNVEFKGYFERLEGDTAEIDGQRVKLENKAKIKGADDWKKLDFKTFNDMMLGAEAEVKGIRKSDGIVYATEIITKPNKFTDNEKELRLKLSQGLGINGIEVDSGLVKNLSNGTAVIGGNEFKLVQDLNVQTYVNKVGFKLVPRYVKDMDKKDPAKLSFRFYAIEDASPNAFAFADGSVFIHTGLLKILKNEAQLAGVIGHEMAHATHEHSRKTNDSLLTKGISLFNSVKNSGDDDLITFGLGIFANKFSRDMENQADRVGLMYMFDAGYDTREVPKVWREMDRLLTNLTSETKQSNNGTTSISIIDLIPKNSKAKVKVDNFLYSSHPEANARLKNLNRVIAYNYYDTDFSQTKVKADEYKEALGYYFGWIKKPVRSTSTPTLPPTKTPTKTNKTKKKS